MTESEERDEREVVRAAVTAEVERDAAWTRFLKVLIGLVVVLVLAEVGILGGIQIHQQSKAISGLSAEHNATVSQEKQIKKLEAQIIAQGDEIIALVKGHSLEFADIKALLKHELSSTAKVAAKAEIKSITTLVIVCINNYSRRAAQSLHNQLESPLAKGCPFVALPEPNRKGPYPPPLPKDPNR